jgi:SAM-dependent methyltransferase
MPHTLELADDPHATLAEVARVLRPEGRVVIVGFNPASLWGLQQWLGRGGRLGRGHPLAPESSSLQAAEFLGYRRVRDWLRLLSFEVEAGRFGLWRPPWSRERTLERFAWMDRVGSHWWPVLGGAYVIEAVKRVRGMRLVGLAPMRAPRGAAAPAVVAQHAGAGRRVAAPPASAESSLAESLHD